MKYYLMITIFLLISCRSNRNIVTKSRQDQSSYGEISPDFSQKTQFIPNKREELLKKQEELLNYQIDSAKYDLEKLDSIAYQVATYDSSYFLMSIWMNYYFHKVNEEFDSRNKKEKEDFVKVLFPKDFDEKSRAGIDTMVLHKIMKECALLIDSARKSIKHSHPILDSLSDDEHKYVFIKLGEMKHNIPMYTKMIEEQYDAIYYFGENIIPFKTEILIEESSNLRKKKKR